MKGGEINKLPYDVIVYFLQLPSIDIDTILQFIQALPQYRSLGYYVLKQYKLPKIYLQAITDQEGKRQYLTQFQFHSLNHHDIDYVTFIANPNNNDHNKKRYISNLSKAARPQLKNITIHHLPSSSSINDKLLERKKSTVSTLSSSISSSTSTSSSSTSLSSSSSSCISDQQQQQQQSIKKTSSSPLLESSLNLIQCHSLSLKYGLHTIYPQHYKKSSIKWQYNYHVSYTDETIDPWLLYSPDQFSHDQKKKEKKKKNDEEKKLKKNKNDMNVTPLCIIVPITLLTKNNLTTPAITTTTPANTTTINTNTFTNTTINVKSFPNPLWYSKCLKVMKKCIPQV